MAKPRIDVIVFSPPFSPQFYDKNWIRINHPRPCRPEGHGEYSDDLNNIGNLRYGKVDVEA